MPASFVYGQVVMDFEVGGRVEKAIFRYKYYASEKKVEYVSAEYTSPALKEKVEGDPAAREKINAYIARMLARRDEGLS